MRNVLEAARQRPCALPSTPCRRALLSRAGSPPGAAHDRSGRRNRAAHLTRRRHHDADRSTDRPDAVPDEVWDEVARHYDEKGLAALVLWIALANLFNRINVSTRQAPGGW